MNLKIYQAYYKEEQMPFLEKGFTPFDNTINEYPELREYPVMKKLQEQQVDYDGHWGLFSWKWREKAGISGDVFIKWVNENPGYDVYVLNPFNDNVVHNNCFVQGEEHHPGMIRYINSLLNELGYDQDIENIVFPINIINYCSFYIGNQKFWEEWIPFCDLCISITKQNREMNQYMFFSRTNHSGYPLINFPFIVERLPMLFLYLNYDRFKVKHYPYLKKIEGFQEDRKNFYERFNNIIIGKTLKYQIEQGQI